MSNTRPLPKNYAGLRMFRAPQRFLSARFNDANGIHIMILPRRLDLDPADVDSVAWKLARSVNLEEGKSERRGLSWLRSTRFKLSDREEEVLAQIEEDLEFLQDYTSPITPSLAIEHPFFGKERVQNYHQDQWNKAGRSKGLIRCTYNRESIKFLCHGEADYMGDGWYQKKPDIEPWGPDCGDFSKHYPADSETNIPQAIHARPSLSLGPPRISVSTPVPP